jgi:hypothetical protein
MKDERRRIDIPTEDDAAFVLEVFQGLIEKGALAPSALDAAKRILAARMRND